MKPRSKIQEKLVEWSNHFPALTDRQAKYAYKHCFDEELPVFCYRNYFYNPNNQKAWKSQGKSIKDVTKVSASETNYKELDVWHRKQKCDKEYFLILTTKGGYQVGRWFMIHRFITVDWNTPVHHKVEYFVRPVGCEWLSTDGKIVSIEKSRCTLCYQIDQWQFWSDMEVRRYSVFTRYLANTACLVQSILPILRRNGWSIRHQFVGGEFEQCVALLRSNWFEMLYKTGQYAICDDVLRGAYRDLCVNGKFEEGSDLIKLIVKLANRHHVKFDTREKWSDMKDYIKDLEYLHKDTHNPQILFPANFQTEHKHIHHIAQKRRDEEERRMIEQRHYDDMRRRDKYNKEVQEWVSMYTKRFGDMEIHCGAFTVKPLCSMSDFKAEADEMHHCIVTYYGKKDALLLSIEHDGKKTETAEISLIKNGKLIQCRGHRNDPSQWHDEIVNILNDNMGEFIRRANLKVNADIIALPCPIEYYKKAI
jgi:hypothetical protein